MGEQEVAEFLTYLAVRRNVAASTQNQALNALVFLYREVLNRPLSENIRGIVRAKRPKRLPVVLTVKEVSAILSQLRGTQWLIACLQYGSGLRLIESVRLRVMDIDFRCQPWRAKRRLVDPSSREAALFSRRALRQRENKVGLRTRRPVIGSQVRSSIELAKLLRSAG
ncbi:phage integrase N-terminal SAM-like domain-containing protein [Thiolapillus sp.]|uniref:phage integrase N-terminal SAM-like domain-containing protein n=1 Tax=Thiolapillus sp. TaxID=2017437 RepID=UPI003AF558A8